MTPESMTPESETRPMSEAGRLTNTFAAPEAAFKDITARPRPWVPLLLGIIASLVMVACISQRIGWEQVLRQQMETNSRVQQLSQEQRDQAIQVQLKFVPVMSYVGPVVAIPVTLLVIAAVVMLCARMFGSAVTFKQMFSIAAYGFLPRVLDTIIAIVVLFLKPEEFNMVNPTGFNVAHYLDPMTTAKWLHSLAGSLDLFTIWSVVLMAIGIGVAAKGNTFSKGLTAVAVPWIILIVLKMGWASIFG